MKSQTAAPPSLWSATADVREFPPLRQDITADVVVVGAGIAGLSVAWLLAKAGKFVVVVDDGPIGGGQTQMTTAHLSNEIDDRYSEIERLHGREGARLAAESHTAAIDLIEAIAREEQIDCDFRRVNGYLMAAPGHSEEILAKEYEAASRTGVVEVSWVDHPPHAMQHAGRALRFARQGQFHPLKYLSGLADALERRGGRIYCGTHAKSMQGGERAIVMTDDGHTITAEALVVATNTPVNDMFAIHTKQAPYTTYVVGLRVPAGSIERALYWDTADPYHYIRLQSGTDDEHDLLIVGGEDHKTGQAHDKHERFDRLESWARDHFPQCGEVEFHWLGQVMETCDGLAFIGPNPGDKPNVFIATGDSGMGMTHGTIAGMLLSDLILGKENPWAKIYQPSRKMIGAFGEFLKENLNVAAQYASYLTPGEVKAVDDIAPGCGALMSSGLTKLAVYKDEQGNVTKMTAVCPHMKCLVDWNDASKTWDCPCHGSRFTADGQVIVGPANVGLEKVQK